MKYDEQESELLKDVQIRGQWHKYRQKFRESLSKMIEEEQIRGWNGTLRFKYFIRGERPEKGYSLVFGLHGGGGCPKEVNDNAYIRHMELYNNYLPEGIIWLTARSCEDVPDMWWKNYIPEFFSYIIKGFTLNKMVNANKIFITGYSAGGDGVYHLGPMMADQLAGAAMMAGHPNGVELYNVRNIAFSIQMGVQDEAYDRHFMAQDYIVQMKSLAEKYGKFSTIYCNLFGNCAHWMQFRDAGIFKTFLNQQRNPYPEMILFKQHQRHPRRNFYYISVDSQIHKELLLVHQRENDFFIQSQEMAVTVMVNRRMVDFQREVRVFHNSSLTVCRRVKKNIEIVRRTIEERGDIDYIFQDQMISIPKTGRIPLETSIEYSLNSPTLLKN